jgi:heme/copper-type cytochrome/quinol oxidase subunit 4
MSEDIYDPPESGFTHPGRNSLFFRVWHGKVQLWKAFWLVHVLGFLLSIVLGILPQYLVLALTSTRLPHIVTMVPPAIVFPITLVCLWRSAPDPKVSIKGALVKMWVFLAAIYYIGMLYRAIADSL